MRSAKPKYHPVRKARQATRSRKAGNPDRSTLAKSLTLAAMSLGYGVVQLDVTIVNTALNSIGSSLGGGVSELQSANWSRRSLADVALRKRDGAIIQS
jgi:MFS transporter, DHA2 family, methylenomycin A resistance protein